MTAACQEVDDALLAAGTAAGVANAADVGEAAFGGAVLAAVLFVAGCPLAFQILVGDAK